MKQKLIKEKEYKRAKAKAPWACTLAKVKDGHMAFESHVDYNKWRDATGRK